MSVDAIIVELKKMYRADLEGTDEKIPEMSHDDVQRWTSGLGISKAALYDEIALHLARAFHEHRLPFRFCDTIVNEIHSLMTVEIRPPLFWSVFLAFDEGEYHHIPGDDPVAEYTRPLIAKIVESNRNTTR